MTQPSPADQLARAERASRREKWETLLAQHIHATGLPEPVRELVFAPPRKWRFDFAWPERKVAAEVEGITHGGGGRHQRVSGFERDAEKYNAAELAGWTVLRFTPGQIKSAYAVRIIDQALRSKTMTDRLAELEKENEQLKIGNAAAVAQGGVLVAKIEEVRALSHDSVNTRCDHCRDLSAVIVRMGIINALRQEVD